MYIIINLPLSYRVNPESDIDDDLDGSVLSLGLFPGEYLDSSTALSGSGMADDRVFFRFEAAWDSSLHNSLLLNRVTPAGETIYMTISAYLEVCMMMIFSKKNLEGLKSISRIFFISRWKIAQVQL